MIEISLTAKKAISALRKETIQECIDAIRGTHQLALQLVKPGSDLTEGYIGLLKGMQENE